MHTVPAQERVMAEDEILVLPGQFEIVLDPHEQVRPERLPVGEAVVVPADQELAAMQPLQERVGQGGTFQREVPQDIDVVGGQYLGVPIPSQCLVHLRRRLEGAGLIFEDIGVTKMGVGGKIDQ